MSEIQTTILLAMIGMIMTFSFGILVGKASIEVQAIEHNCAKYNSQTSNFEWIENKDKELEEQTN